MNAIKLLICVIICLLSGCEFGDSNKHLEKQIRGEVLRHLNGIATLEASYILTFIHFEEHLITSNDFYVQKDIANIDYGFDLDDKSISVINENGVRKLKVRLGKGEAIAVDRKNISSPKTTHKGYLPKNAQTGETIDVDQKINQELDELKRKYGEQNLKHARANARNFFRIIAAKYDLELDFE